MASPWKPDDQRWGYIFLGVLVLVFFCLMFGGRVFGQGDPRPQIQTVPIMTIDDQGRLVVIGDFTNHALRVNVVAGSSGGPSGTIGAAFPSSVVPLGVADASGFLASLTLTNGYLNTTCNNCTSAPATNFASAFPAAGSAVGFKDPSGFLASGSVDNSGNLAVVASQGAANSATPWYMYGVTRIAGPTTFTAAAQTLEIDTSGMAVVHIQALDLGSWNGDVVWEGTINGTAWFQIRVVDDQGQIATGYNSPISVYRVPVQGLARMRLRVSTWVSGTQSVTLGAAPGDAGQIKLAAPLPGGTNQIGAVAIKRNDGTRQMYLTGGDGNFASAYVNLRAEDNTEMGTAANPLPVLATGTISAHQADTWTVNCSNCSAATPTNYGAAFPASGGAVGFKDGKGFLASATVDNAGFLLVTASQGTANAIPWNVAATGTISAHQADAWTVTANQGTSPWVVSGTTTATGTVTAHQGDAWTVGLSSGATVIATGTITAHQGDAWTVSLGTGSNTIGALTANQSMNLAQVAGTTTVTAGTSGLLAVGGPAATAAQASGNPLLAGAVFVGTNSRSNLTDGQMSWQVVDKRGAILNTPSVKVTYRAGTATAQSGVVVAPASTSPFFCMYGSSTKTVLVQRVMVTGPTLATAQMGTIVLAKYSTGVVGGAGVGQGLVAVRMDSATASSTVTNLTVYTTAPTAGNLLGPVGVRRVWMPITSTAGGSNSQDAIFDHRPMSDASAIVLRGTTEGVCANFGAAPATAVTLGVDVEWTEE